MERLSVQPFIPPRQSGPSLLGYTSCPDVCPTTLAEMRVLHEKLGANAKDVAVVFVSVGSERDTPQRLGEYVPLFNDAFYGVHSEPAALETAKEGYGVVAQKVLYNPQDRQRVIPSITRRACISSTKPAGW